jgi:hypothetical protein
MTTQVQIFGRYGLYIFSAYPSLSALGAESKVCYPGNTADRQAHVLPPLAVNSKSEWKVNSLPPLGFEPVI